MPKILPASILPEEAVAASGYSLAIDFIPDLALMLSLPPFLSLEAAHLDKSYATEGLS